ncbi:putative receptor-like protein kinase At3g47110 [Papaver somniferum]|uniref:putative receptor-like protein kinase At3g47110 n=1 Tax=Papaver somniferum TaxID=3469 RepID=UPI000E6F963D|nr:putative receptor-like protein kinase At3g47110 [Papaver somniferum]
MKLLRQPQNSFNSSTILVLLCSLTLTISYMDVNCLAAIGDDNKSSDHLALIAFKKGITQDTFGMLSSWNDKNNSLHFCEWGGVTCSRRHPRRVTKINLRSQKLVGSISPHIGNLSFLEELILSNNSLSGEIPQQIGRLFRLRRLGLSNNSLEGEIPHNISRCSNLIQLNISRNYLVGRIPNELGYLFNLIVLNIIRNNLSGEIPASLGNLSSLIYLDLNANNLEGRIPNSLSKLRNLQHLVLGLNKLSGTIPSSVYNISSLRIFSAMNNQLHGSIPFDIGFTLPNLNFFLISNNNFTGTIPSSFSNSSRLEILQLDNNNLVGSVPYNLGNSKSLDRILLGENKLGSGQANDLDFINSLVNCTDLRWLNISANNFGGVLPSYITNLTTNLRILDFRGNYIYGSIPPGIQNLQGLRTLSLGSNQFTGSVPPSIGLFQNLGILELDSNKLYGAIPSSLSNVTRLIKLSLYDNNLTGLVPSSLGYCKSLQLLDLHSNRLSGSIPVQIFRLPSLSLMLDLSNNSFTGSVPVEIGSLRNLGELYLHTNKLFGEIPSSIGQCLALRYLKLQGNFFQGHIPPTIESLKGLESLNLSHNNFSGIIPKGLEILRTLVELDLSYNNLEGAVPQDGVFENASKFLIVGNRKLCGGIPVLKLQSCPMPFNPDSKQNQRKSISVGVIVIIIILVGLFITLIVFYLTLYWRIKSKSKLPSTNLDVGIRFKGVSYTELSKATNGFNDSTNLLGVGSFGSVYKGILRQDELNPVAVKVLHLQRRGATKSFMAECDFQRNARHTNLLKIVTCCSSTDCQGNDFKALVFEFMSNGSLEDWLHPNIGDRNNNGEIQVKNLNLKRRLNIAVDVASALNYLHHECVTPLVHCDLKPSNVLLDDALIAHVSDFGLAQFLSNPTSTSRQLNEQDANSVEIMGSIGYVAPEYGMCAAASTQGDVYSYGILLLEMFTGKRPTDDMFKDGLDIHKFSKLHAFPERVLDIIDSRLLLELENEHLENTETNSYNMPRSERRNRARHTTRQILASIIQIGVICSSELPCHRISMNEVIGYVEVIKNQYLGIRM